MEKLKIIILWLSVSVRYVQYSDRYSVRYRTVSVSTVSPYDYITVLYAYHSLTVMYSSIVYCTVLSIILSRKWDVFSLFVERFQQHIFKP